MKPAIAIAVLVAVLLAVWLLTSSLDAIVERAIESYGSELAGVAVRVDRVEISLTQGRGRVSGLSVANPPGFEGRHALYFDEITLAIDTGSVGKNPLVITELQIEAPAASYELDKAGRNNFDVIRKHIASQGGNPPAEPERDEDPLRIRIRHFRLAAGSMHLDARAAAGGKLEVELPSLELRDLGAPDGVPPAALGARILGQIVGDIVQRSARGAVGKLVDEGAGAVKGLFDRLRR